MSNGVRFIESQWTPQPSRGGWIVPDQNTRIYEEDMVSVLTAIGLTQGEDYRINSFISEHIIIPGQKRVAARFVTRVMFTTDEAFIMAKIGL